MIVVSDTSPITNLLKIGEIKLLNELFGRIIIPVHVEKELNRIPFQKEFLKMSEWIEVASISNNDLFNRLITEVHSGEAAAMVLAIELRADYLLIDEQKGRAVAESLGIPVTGLIGIFILAKKKGFILEIKPYLQKLVYEAEFYLSPNLFQKVIRAVGEN